MCGLAGVARVDGRPLSGEFDTVLAGMARALAHRGPDDDRLVRDGAVGLAFTRLSLVDPERGGQPLVSEDGSVVLIANGEIYNHRELAAGARMRTGSDCEVLLGLYQRHGLRFLDRVRGMFAVVLWDRTRGRLLFARDHFGVKPLYFHRGGAHITFASEITALFENPDCPRRLDWRRALEHQAFSAAPVITDATPTTWFDGIEEVPAATILDIDLRDGTTRTHRYWTRPEPQSDAPPDRELIAEFGRLLADSVTGCATADAEVGLFLSGGIDSAAVAALAGGGALHTFTVLSGSTVYNGDAESASRVAAGLGLPNHQILFGPDRIPTVDEWKHLLWLTEMPQCGPEQFYKYEMHRYVKAFHPEIKGMLLGGGADEYTGGYLKMFAGDGGWNAADATLRELVRNGLLQRKPGLSIWWDTELPLLTDAALAGDDSCLDDPYAVFLDWKFRDIQQYNCWHEDRTAAGNGIEARVPFLDVRLVELVASIPVARRPALLWDKRIVREALRGILPDDVVERPKVAFYHGDGVRQTQATYLRMLCQDGHALVAEALESPTAKDLVDADNLVAQLRALAEDPAAGQVEQVLRIVNLGLLDGMASRPPARHADTRRAPVPVAVDGSRWSTGREALADRAVRRPGIDPAAVPRWRPDVMLLTAPSTPDLTYVAVDGTLTYVLPGAEARPWLSFLEAVDGSRSVAEILATIDTPLDALREELTDALDLGLLSLDPVPDQPAA